MFGLIVLLVIAAYIAVSVLVVKATMRWARRRGRSATRWGWGAGLVMYLLVFWDFIPTVALHRYLCATEQGFWVYKTVEQWQQENPGVAETLRRSDSSKSFTTPGTTRGYVLNQRFVWEVVKSQPLSILPVWVTEHRVVDRPNEEVMAKHVSVGAGYGNLAVGGEGSWKFWLSLPPCHSSRPSFDRYVAEIEHQGEKK